MTGIAVNRKLRAILEITGFGSALGVYASTSDLLVALNGSCEQDRDVDSTCR